MSYQVPKQLLYYYANLPKSWAEPTTEINSAVEVKLNRAIKNMKEYDLGGAIFTTGEASHIVEAMLNNGVDMTDILGVDFADYFDKKFSKSDDAYEIHPKKYTFVYNVGMEAALNKAYSAQILKGIMAKVTNDGGWVIINSPLSKTSFEQDYGVSIKNSLTLPKKIQKEVI